MPTHALAVWLLGKLGVPGVWQELTGTQAKVPCNSPATLFCYYFLFNALTFTSIDLFSTICLAALGLSCIMWDLS